MDVLQRQRPVQQQRKEPKRKLQQKAQQAPNGRQGEPRCCAAPPQLLDVPSLPASFTQVAPAG